MNPLLLVLFSLISLLASTNPSSTTQPDGQHVALKITGGFDTEPVDHGRPVVLVANALGVKPQVFRDAFKKVHPAGPNSGGPSDAEARANKKVLMDALSPYGVTDERLNEVSNYYRYQKSKGELWKHKDADCYAIVNNGKVVSIVLNEHGAGYSSTPTVTVDGLPNVKLTATVKYGTELKTNGELESVELTK